LPDEPGVIISGRCTFYIDINGSAEVFVMWQMPAEDHELLKESEEAPVTDINGSATRLSLPTIRMIRVVRWRRRWKINRPVLGADPDQVRSFVELLAGSSRIGAKPFLRGDRWWRIPDSNR
jgi:hypothetical protein